MPAQDALKKAIAYLERKVDGGKAGLIAIDRHKNYGFHFNTKKMACAYKDPKTGKTVAFVKL